jgi:hypothetical protein
VFFMILLISVKRMEGNNCPTEVSCIIRRLAEQARIQRAGLGWKEGDVANSVTPLESVTSRPALESITSDQIEWKLK